MFRSPTVFPTVEAEKHRCRMVEMRLGESEVHDPNPSKHKSEILAYRQGVIDGKTEGYDVGYQQGYDHGYQQGDTDNAVVATQYITGKWYEFKVNLLIPEGENPPLDALEFLRWLQENHRFFLDDPSLISLNAETPT